MFYRRDRLGACKMFCLSVGLKDLNRRIMNKPRYQSKKIVEALKINGVFREVNLADTREYTSKVSIMFEGTWPSLQGVETANRPMPQPGMYMVWYSDGYYSFCPGDVFEKEHTLLAF
jgi:hypothetical protein